MYVTSHKFCSPLKSVSSFVSFLLIILFVCCCSCFFFAPFIYLLKTSQELFSLIQVFIEDCVMADLLNALGVNLLQVVNPWQHFLCVFHSKRDKFIQSSCLPAVMRKPTLENVVCLYNVWFQ